MVLFFNNDLSKYKLFCEISKLIDFAKKDWTDGVNLAMHCDNV